MCSVHVNVGNEMKCSTFLCATLYLHVYVMFCGRMTVRAVMCSRVCLSLYQRPAASALCRRLQFHWLYRVLARVIFSRRSPAWCRLPTAKQTSATISFPDEIVSARGIFCFLLLRGGNFAKAPQSSLRTGKTRA